MATLTAQDLNGLKRAAEVQRNSFGLAEGLSFPLAPIRIGGEYGRDLEEWMYQCMPEMAAQSLDVFDGN